MDEPRTRKEGAVADDRANPAEDGAWFWLRGKDAVRILRAFARWDAGSRVVGLLLLVAAVWYLRELVIAVLDLTAAMKGR